MSLIVLCGKVSAQDTLWFQMFIHWIIDVDEPQIWTILQLWRLFSFVLRLFRWLSNHIQCRINPRIRFYSFGNRCISRNWVWINTPQFFVSRHEARLYDHQTFSFTSHPPPQSSYRSSDRLDNRQMEDYGSNQSEFRRHMHTRPQKCSSLSLRGSTSNVNGLNDGTCCLSIPSQHDFPELDIFCVENKTMISTPLHSEHHHLREVVGKLSNPKYKSPLSSMPRRHLTQFHHGFYNSLDTMKQDDQVRIVTFHIEYHEVENGQISDVSRYHSSIDHNPLQKVFSQYLALFFGLNLWTDRDTIRHRFVCSVFNARRSTRVFTIFHIDRIQ
jgi:hypothetical protein